MLRGSADDSGWPNALIERYEPTLIPDGQRQQIAIGDLLRTKQLVMLEDVGIGKTDIVRPEAMMFCCLRARETLEDGSYR